MVADIYLASSNAVTEDGKLINTDGTGNRISSMLFGHDRVILICGENKIVKDEAEGRKRISEVVAPKNAERLNLTVKANFQSHFDNGSGCGRHGSFSLPYRRKSRFLKATIW